MNQTGLGSLFGGLFGGSIGQGISGGLGNSLSQQNAYQNWAQQPPSAQQALQALQYQGYMAQQMKSSPKWMINGRSMSLTEFVKEVYGDTPAGTMFLLKYSDKGK